MLLEWVRLRFARPYCDHIYGMYQFVHLRRGVLSMLRLHATGVKVGCLLGYSSYRVAYS